MSSVTPIGILLLGLGATFGLWRTVATKKRVQRLERLDGAGFLRALQMPRAEKRSAERMLKARALVANALGVDKEVLLPKLDVPGLDRGANGALSVGLGHLVDELRDREVPLSHSPFEREAFTAREAVTWIASAADQTDRPLLST